MRKILCAVAVLGFAASASFAAFGTVSSSVFVASATITDVGTVAMSATLSSGSQLTWSGITLGTTKWKGADNYIVLNSTVTTATGGIQIYTDNRTHSVQVSTMAAVPGGLVNAAARTQTLPLCWRIVDVTTTTAIQQGAAGYPDRLWDTKTGDQYPCYIWMKDKATASVANGGTLPWATSASFVPGEPYITMKDSVNGVMHAEITYAAMPSPDYIYVGANFLGAAGGSSYSGKIVIEAFNE